MPALRRQGVSNVQRYGKLRNFPTLCAVWKPLERPLITKNGDNVDLLDLSLIKTDGARRILLDVADVVRGHDDCAAVAGNCAEELHNAVGRGWVEVAGRFVGENHLRVVQQRTCDG